MPSWVFWKGILMACSSKEPRRPEGPDILDTRMVLKFSHTPVMLSEVVSFLKCSARKLYVDATVGGGGHAKAILEASQPSGRLFGIDQDPDAVRAALENLKLFGNRVTIRQGSFSKIGNLVRETYSGCIDGMLLDLGVSSYQLDMPLRGFSFGKAGPLDMRMNPDLPMSAADVVRDCNEEELAGIIFEFGEERYAKRIANGIVKRRRISPIVTTQDLVQVVLASVPPAARRGKIHPATRTFQALRIYVNNELGELKNFLEDAPSLLCPEGRLVIIDYHSLEDRLVKRAFRDWERRGGYKVVTKRVVTPSDEETRKNRRSRSAKLRVLEREDQYE